MMSQPLFENTVILARLGVDIIKIVTIFIQTILKDSRKIKRVGNYLSKCNLYIYISQNNKI